MGRPMRYLLASTLLVLPTLLVQTSPVQGGRTGAVSWNRDAAAQYLDRRMDIWFERGQKLATDGGPTTCVSCHTVVPYALARPGLRRAMHVDAPTVQEVRLAEETSRRVRAADSREPLYEGDEAQSTGTEAVLYALILASADASGAPGANSDATRLAFTHMWRAQRDNGAWNWLDVGLEPFESIDSAFMGAAFAALAVGMAPAPAVEPNAEGVSKLQAYLSSHFAAQNLHNRVWGLLASLSLHQPLPTRDADALLGELQSHQGQDGGWSLNGLGGWRWNRAAAPFRSPGTRDESLLAQSDAYATGLIVYTLRQAGVSGDRDFMKKGRRWLEAHQMPVRAGDQQWFAWRSYSLNYDREHGGSRGEDWRRLFMSDAATAFATLGLLASE